jgi:nucleotide-binding universal stress UspA family protein
MFHKIVFAHDGGMLAERALVYLEHVARVEEAEVIVLHVYELPERYATTDGYEALQEQYKAVAQEVVDDAVAYLEEREISARGFTVSGDCARAILDVADREEAGLIVMGTRGMTNRSPIADLVLGNVAQEVLRHAHCPVLVVP